MRLAKISSLAGVLIAAQVTARAVTPQVTITVDRLKYCLGTLGPVAREDQPPHAITLRLRLRASYWNPGTIPMILPIYHEVSALIVRPTPSSRGTPLIFNLKRLQEPTDELPEDVAAETPFNPWFAVISPHTVLDRYFTEDVDLCVHDCKQNDQRHELLGTRLILRLQLSHSALSSRLQDQLRTAWKNYGRLWDGTVISAPFTIEVPESPVISDCSHDYVM